MRQWQDRTKEKCPHLTDLKLGDSDLPCRFTVEGDIYIGMQFHFLIASQTHRIVSVGKKTFKIIEANHYLSLF